MRWLTLAFLLLSAAPAWATFAEVSSGSQRASAQVFNSDSTTLAFPGSVTTNNLLVVWGSAWASGVPGSISVTDSQGTYTVVSCPSGSDTYRNFIAWRQATATGSNTVTVDPAGTGTYFSFTIDEFSMGTGKVPVLDATGACTSGLSATPSGTISPVNPNTLLLGVVSGTEGQTIAPGGSYTQAGEMEPTHPHNAEFRVVTTAQTYTVDWTVGGIVHWTMSSIALREGQPDTQAPTVPQGLNCVGQSSSSIACTWSASSDNVAVVDYVLERSPAGCATFATIATPTVTSNVDLSLSANTTYCYRVSARDGSLNQSVASSVVSVTTLNTRQATLRWTNNGTYTSVVIERCAPTAGCSNFSDYATVTGTATSYVDSASQTPVSGYRVRATLTGTTDSSPSNIVYTSQTPPILSVSPPTLTYGAVVAGSNPPTQAVTISNLATGAPMVWTLSDDATWFSCTPASGSNNTVLSCSVDVSSAGSVSGTQFATITVSAPGATNSPTTVVVTLNLAPPSNPGTPPSTGRGGRIR